MRAIVNLFIKMLVLGAGDVVLSRVGPSLRELAEKLGIREVVYLDVVPPVGPGPVTDPARERFVLLPRGASVVEVADREGMLGGDTLVLVCTPTEFHISNARELAPHVMRVAVEKPLCRDPKEAAGLLDLEGRVYPLGHQLFKAEMLRLTADCARGRVASDDLAHLRFTLLESKGVGTRQIDDATWDLGWHGIECTVAPVQAIFEENIRVEIRGVQVGTYRAGPDNPQVTTAARIDARLVTPVRSIPTVIAVGKGVGVDQKGLEVFGPDGWLVRAVSLSEGGHHAHRRMIEELWTEEKPDMQLDLRQVVRVVEACADAADRSVTMPDYQFGELPGWLTADLPELFPAEMA